MNKILVLGGCGYIGSRLCPQLSTWYDVTVVDSLIYKQKQVPLGWINRPISFAYDDVRHFVYNNSLDKFDCVINLAAIVGAPACKKDPTESFSVNSEFVNSLVKRLSPRQRLIQMTSTSGYGSGHCDETSPLNPLSLYGKQKVAAERYVLDHKNSLSLRLATVMGLAPRMRFDLMVNYFVQELWFKDKLTVFEPDFKRNFVHIQDVVDVIAKLIHTPVYGVFNVGHPSGNFTKLQLIHDIVKVMYGKNKSYVPLISIAEGKDEDQRNCTISTEKIEKLYQFKYDLSYGVEELLYAMKFLSEKDIQKMNNTWIYDNN